MEEYTELIALAVIVFVLMQIANRYLAFLEDKEKSNTLLHSVALQIAAGVKQADEVIDARAAELMPEGNLINTIVKRVLEEIPEDEEDATLKLIRSIVVQAEELTDGKAKGG